MSDVLLMVGFGCGLGEEDNKESHPSSSHHIKRMHYRHGSSLMLPTWIPG